LIVALSLFGAWDLVLRVRGASSSAARAALAVSLVLPAFLGGSLGYIWGTPEPLLKILALFGLGIVLFALCVVGGARTRSFEAAGATLLFFVVATLIGSVR
jgi:hypothetical protein